MGLIVSKQDVTNSLKSAISSCEIGKSPVLYHCDIGRIGILDALKSRREMLEDYLQCLLDTGQNRTTIIPTFNYDFCQTGLYDVTNDVAQVGTLNDYVRALGYPRTKTPIFNVCFLNRHEFSLDACTNPLGPKSTFSELVDNDGWIGFLGADFSSATLLHFMEERMNIGYRYLKQFNGKILTPSETLPVTIDYRVRPRAPNAAVPRWDELKQELLNQGILRSFSLGNGHVLFCRAADVVKYWTQYLQKDELYFLSDASRLVVQALYNRHGRPLTVANVEGISNT